MRWIGGICCLLAGALCVGAGAQERPRLLVLTDIGQDPDDQQSLVRLLTYANEFEVEGIVATADSNSSKEAAVVRDDIVHEAIARYGEVLPNLRLHDPGYPDAAVLDAVVKPGSPWGGEGIPAAQTIGPERDTEGSKWIIARTDKEDPRPLNVAVWGGACDLAQALWRVRESRSPAEVDVFVSRLRVHSIGDQDGTNPWIRAEFPKLFHIHDLAPVGTKFDSAYRGIFLGGDLSTLSREWLYANVKEGHGALGAFYPDKTFTQANTHGCIKEGDTPSWFYFLANGLQDAAHPDYGGWGGRFGREETWWRDQQDTVDGTTSYRATVWRWRGDFQNDFAARMDWCVKPFAGANHAPKAVLDGDTTRAVLHRQVRGGTIVDFSAAGSSDPDVDALTFAWRVYPEAGSYGGAGELRVEGSSTDSARIAVPKDAAGKTIHLILEVRDAGEPPLVAYRRVVLDVVE